MNMNKIYSCSSICDNGAVAVSVAGGRWRFAARSRAIRDISGVIRLIFSSSSASARR